MLTVFGYICRRCSWRVVIRQVWLFRCIPFRCYPCPLLVNARISHAATSFPGDAYVEGDTITANRLECDCSNTASHSRHGGNHLYCRRWHCLPENGTRNGKGA